MSEANTQDLVVKKCKVVDRGYTEPQVVCEVDWHGRTEDMFLDSLLNELNKTAVFAHGYAESLKEAKIEQLKEIRASEKIKTLEKRISKVDLKKLQKEADLREYSDEEYIDLLEGYLKS